MTVLLFPSEPFDLHTTDSCFSLERDVASQMGFETALVDHTAVTQGRARDAVSMVRREGPALYRGWMLTLDQYTLMAEALLARNACLVNTPEQYKLCHYLPENYSILDGVTPRSVWLRLEGAPDFGRIIDCAAQFGRCPIVVKDYVKSQKHYWKEACFIPDATDSVQVERVVRRFLELQGSDLNLGLVLREYVPLKIVGHHPRSGMPLAAEFRTFWGEGQLVLAHKYWAELASFEANLPMRWIYDVARKVESRFFTMDIALRSDDTWTVIELGDGQVAGLPTPEVAELFYRQLALAFPQ